MQYAPIKLRFNKQLVFLYLLPWLLVFLAPSSTNVIGGIILSRCLLLICLSSFFFGCIFNSGLGYPKSILYALCSVAVLIFITHFFFPHGTAWAFGLAGIDGLGIPVGLTGGNILSNLVLPLLFLGLFPVLSKRFIEEGWKPKAVLATILAGLFLFLFAFGSLSETRNLLDYTLVASPSSNAVPEVVLLSPEPSITPTQEAVSTPLTEPTPSSESTPVPQVQDANRTPRGIPARFTRKLVKQVGVAFNVPSDWLGRMSYGGISFRSPDRDAEIFIIEDSMDNGQTAKDGDSFRSKLLSQGKTVLKQDLALAGVPCVRWEYDMENLHCIERRISNNGKYYTFTFSCSKDNFDEWSEAFDEAAMSFEFTK